MLEINNRDLFKSLRVCKLETQLAKKIQKCLKGKRKVKSSYSKKYMLENVILAQDWSRTVVSQMSGSQKDGCQVVWTTVPGDLVSFSGLANGCQVDIYMSPSVE